MLPDYPKLKRKLGRILETHMRHVQAKHTGPLSEIPSGRLQESHVLVMVRRDGSKQQSAAKPHRVSIRFTDDELEHLPVEDLIRRYDAAAKEMAFKTAKTFFECVDQAVAEVGNVHKYSGTLTLNDLYEMWEKVETEFDSRGNAYPMTLCCAESMRPHAEELYQQMATDAAWRHKIEQLMIKKKEQWRDREACRKLVD